ncbi:DUF262 domain-containing protein [Labrenzia sp. CE80]|uniref:GmrSD restriction endonuclease domain-containing protein n=1 Tax=Labrenzia sp. CE80 TaxID=1788986 RepID=UPI0025703A7F|nr:DUF262 domain-containing protein [Labrenzia sp. CE80]
MIQRADFALQADALDNSDAIAALSVESLSKTGMVNPLLRKPDFQRETNHWSPAQVVAFLESFLDNELIPSIILWRSSSYVFVIDGGHRLSALRAWIEDDYGDRDVSIKYFSSEISGEQKKIGERTRKLVESRIGRYETIKDALINQEKYDELKVRRAKNMAVRSLSLQWVNGDAEKAETSFFKINTLGTPLDKSEEFLLRNRRKAIAIAARSIVRAGTGHKYWSKFEDEKKNNIEEYSKNVHRLIFDPEVKNPIKTLDLPLGGNKSPLSAFDLLMRLLSITSPEAGEVKDRTIASDDDLTGDQTISVLRKCEKVLGRITGNDVASLGLHPAVYFYSERGRHIPDLLLGVISVFTKAIENNDKSFFQKFTSRRELIEKYLVSNKSIVTQALQIPRSIQRVSRVEDLFLYFVKSDSSEQYNDEAVVSVIAPNSASKLVAIRETSETQKFSTETKSMIYIRESLKNAMFCPVCKGYLDPTKSVSYDHKIPVREGGQGNAENGQLMHPYCNAAVKC